MQAINQLLWCLILSKGVAWFEERRAIPEAENGVGLEKIALLTGNWPARKHLCFQWIGSCLQNQSHESPQETHIKLYQWSSSDTGIAGDIMKEGRIHSFQ